MKKKILIPVIAGIALIIGIIVFIVIKSSASSFYNIQIMNTLGSVSVDRDGNSLEAYEGMKMRDKDYIKLAADGFSRFNCDRETYSYFEHDTEASFNADSDKKLVINLIKGEMVVELQKKLNSDEALTIKTSNTTMSIRGTVIAIKSTKTEDGGTRTVNYCLEGQADVETSDGKKETLDAGEGWLTVTDNSGNITESTSAGAESFEFSNIDINSLKGADDSPMILNYSGLSINSTNFPDNAFRQYILENIDTDKNNILSDAEASAEKITVENLGIKDLTGIEFFKDLTYLVCQKNNLSSLDLSQNTQLKSLYCKENNITDLNIGTCSELIYLSCSKNQLAELDISKNSKLQELICTENQLNKIDTRNISNLQSLDCGENKITELDLSNNTSLTFLSCYSNELTKLDISKNTALTGLFCHQNLLTGIDVSKLLALQSLFIGDNKLTTIDIQNNTELTQLSVYSNQLTSVDVSHNTKLSELICDSNELTSLDVSNNPELTNLSCAFNKISNLDISHNPKLARLMCMYNELLSIDAKNNPDLQDIDYDKGKTTIIR
ncbi:MAG: FecR domain-containing protein [Lachnospiraceae bacterium]|nr:FecR domain-containing protein [Lachnospiraceae bacterium]